MGASIIATMAAGCVHLRETRFHTGIGMFIFTAYAVLGVSQQFPVEPEDLFGIKVKRDCAAGGQLEPATPGRRRHRSARQIDSLTPWQSDRWHHQPLYEALVLKAREMHLAGATVLRGPMGYGKSSHLHTSKILRLSMDLPLIIEIVDSEEKINSFLPVLDEMRGGGVGHAGKSAGDTVSGWDRGGRITRDLTGLAWTTSG
jgi:uncharacterized protein